MLPALLSFPDILAMLFLMATLGWLRSRHRQERVSSWLLGLGFVLLQTCANALLHSSAQPSRLWLTLSLDASLLAGFTFGWAARHSLVPGSNRLPYFVLPALPMGLLTTMFGCGVESRATYLWVIAGTLVLGDAFILLTLRRRPRFMSTLLVTHLALWVPMLVFASLHDPRTAVYWGLGGIYLVVALAFHGRIRRDRIGALVLVFSFVIWALCFFAYPLARAVPVYDQFLQEAWKMQKFLVILGMLLMLLEEETDQRRQEAMHDALTGLPNRRLLEDRLLHAIERSRRTGLPAGLFVLDLNGFKGINDRHGHRMGDEVLKFAADHLQRAVRSSDTLARCGGDEFCIVVNELAHEEAAEIVAATLRQAISNMELPQRCELSVSASVGFALYPRDADAPDSLAELADVRMYRDKRATARVLGRS